MTGGSRHARTLRSGKERWRRIILEIGRPFFSWWYYVVVKRLLTALTGIMSLWMVCHGTMSC